MQKTIDDDEVAVLHASEQDNFLALNNAIANIRAAVEKALNKKNHKPPFS